MYPTAEVGPNKMTSGNRPVPTMAFIPRYRGLLKRDCRRRRGRLQCPSRRASQWHSSGKSQVPLRTGPVQSPLLVQAVIMVTSSGMVQPAFQAWETFHFHGWLSSAVVADTVATDTWRWVAWWPHVGELIQVKSWPPVRQEALLAKRGLLHSFHTLE